MSKLVKILIFTIISIIVLTIIGVIVYNYELGAVSKESSKVEFEVAENSTYLSISSDLKEKGLIKSELFYKIYVKLNNPSGLKRGKYALDKNMTVKEIVNILSGYEGYTPDAVTITFIEGIHMREVARVIALKTNNSEQDVYDLLNDEEYLDALIDKYWFITSDIKKEGIYYALEGYLFPDTYQYVNADVKVEDIFEKMLDKMDQVLSKYKKDIDNSGYSVHEILTLASIVEYEAPGSDRAKIAGVFYNRLNIGMKLQSCATVGYAIKEWKLRYSTQDLLTDSPYNTYMYEGLPVGPGCLASEDSINATLHPEKTDYLYFLANVYDNNDTNTYFAKTYAEHQKNCKKYLGGSC